MLRRLFTLLSAASLAFCAAACVLWVRSYWQVDGMSWNDEYTDAAGRQVRPGAEVMSASGGLLVYAGTWTDSPADGSRFAADPPKPFDVVWRTNPYPRPIRLTGPTAVQWFGFGWEGYWRREDRGSTVNTDSTVNTVGSVFTLVLPLWFVALLAAGLPAWWYRAHARRRRVRLRLAGGLCVRCGYDLRASPGRCPECGAVSEGATA